VWETESVLVEKQLNFFSCSWAFSAELNFSWVELLQLQLSFFSWVELQLSWTSSTAVELFQLQLSFLNYSWTSTSTVNLFDHTPVQPASGPVELRFSLLNFLVKTSSTSPQGWFNWSLTPLTRLTSSLPVRLGDMLTKLSRVVQPVLVNLTRLCSSLPVRLADRLPGLPGAVQPPHRAVQLVWVRNIWSNY
jgi:hypothetical protein